ncbi:MAG: FAD-binding oxidoreductase [Rhodovibrionaceae bacterium]
MQHEEHIESYYAATLNDPSVHLPLEGESRADVCVIGGGLTGISAALNLAERGYKVILLEANRIAWGASGRNGGQVCTGYSCGMEKIEKWAGREGAKRFWDLAEESKGIVRERVEKHRIDCDLTWGYYMAACKPGHLKELNESCENWIGHYGYDAEFKWAATPEQSRAFVDSPDYVGGVWESGAGHLHPLNYALGLARAAKEAGAEIHEASPVQRIEQGRQAVVHTPQGQVTAGAVLVCCNAYLGRLVPQLTGIVMPIANYIGATPPLDEATARRLLPGNDAVSNSRFIVNYYRLSPDRRLLFGGLASYSLIDPPNLRQALQRDMQRTFPQLGDVPFDRVWGGRVGISMNRSPHVGRLGSNLYFAQGYSGQGVALTGLMGRVLAEAVAGEQERLDLFAKLPHSHFPGGLVLRTPVLALAMAWFRIKDALG